MIHPIIQLLFLVLNVVNFLLILWIIISWLINFNVLNTTNRFVYSVYDALNRLFEPVLKHIRKYMPDTGTLDLSPIVLFLLIKFAEYCLDYYFVHPSY